MKATISEEDYLTKKQELVANEEVSTREYQPSIWKHNKTNGSWQLYYEIQEKRNGFNPKIFKTLKIEEEFKLGSVVFYNNSFYKLLNINEDNDSPKATIFSIKDQDKLKAFQVPLQEISLTFKVRVYTFGEKATITEITLTAGGNTEELFNKIRELQLVNEEMNFILVGNGAIINEGIFYDQLDFNDKMKILITVTRMKTSIMKRFTAVSRGACYDMDFLTININKKIKLTGLGIMSPCESQSVGVKLKIIEGVPECEVNCLFTEDYILPIKSNENDATTIFTFKKPIIIAPFINYSIIANFTNQGIFFFGYDGKKTVELENNLIFNFDKETRLRSSSHSISNSTRKIMRGLIAEFHYSL